jgi:hypothetical protein
LEIRDVVSARRHASRDGPAPKSCGSAERRSSTRKRVQADRRLWRPRYDVPDPVTSNSAKADVRDWPRRTTAPCLPLPVIC